ncbi:MBL fold metallo-hydrolase [Sphingomonas hengshuiensis]|uniref:Metallo-beta-lactamase domain-containing protein n=1 Tax=Sphingomonas hengshuiensis TaxID=1609977 RepID=A0A7U4J7Q4_9SPHN|nr:MBL fold metallo-hydrolase [Sphingomonas hengshuiensis]AJP71800.1 hypothetical protein TS85_08395 [Sphingomonas hengshuiensis]
MMLSRTLLLALAMAATPAAAQTAPYRLQLGDTAVIALSDGTFDLSTEALLIEPRPGEVAELLAKAGKPATLPTAVNAFLVERDGHRVLIDTGSGTNLGPALGKVGAALEAANIAPDSIEAVLITHLHPDHVGGLVTPEGKAAFPDATVWIETAERAYWTDPANREKADDAAKGTFDAVAAALAPYIAAGKVSTFAPGQEVVAGVTSVALAGHTPGHAGYRIEGGGQVLLAWGDIVHAADVQFTDPAIAIRFDSDPASAQAARLALFQDAAAKGYWIAAAHIAYPGIGGVRAADGHFEWVSIE